MLAGGLVEAERGGLGLDEHEERHDEREQPADVAQAPAIARDAADRLGRGDLGQERIVEDRRELEGNVRDHEQRQREHHLPGLREEQRRRGRDADDGHDEERALARARPVGVGPEHGREQDDEEGRQRHAARPEFGPADLVGRDGLREVRRVDERHDERREGRVGEVVERPRPDRPGLVAGRGVHRAAEGSGEASRPDTRGRINERARRVGAQYPLPSPPTDPDGRSPHLPPARRRARRRRPRGFPHADLRAPFWCYTAVRWH